VWRPRPRYPAAARSAVVSTSRRRVGHSPSSRSAPDARCAAAEPGPKLGSSSVPGAAVSMTVPVPMTSGTKARGTCEARPSASASSPGRSAGRSEVKTARWVAASAARSRAAAYRIAALRSARGPSCRVSMPVPATALRTAGSPETTTTRATARQFPAACIVSSAKASARDSRETVIVVDQRRDFAAARRLTGIRTVQSGMATGGASGATGPCPVPGGPCPTRRSRRRRPRRRWPSR